MRSISVASREAGGRSRLIFDPARVERPLDVEQVLNRKGHAGERTDAFAGGYRGIDLARPGASALGGDVGEGIEHLVVLPDPRQRSLGNLDGR